MILKKLILMAFLAVLCIIVTGCTSKEAKETIQHIEAIGEVSATSGTAICEAEQLYEKLTDEDKEAVTNYGELEAARTAYQGLLYEL